MTDRNGVGRRMTDEEAHRALEEAQRALRELRAWVRTSRRRWNVWRVLWVASLLCSAFAWYRAEDGRHDAIQKVNAQAHRAAVAAAIAHIQTHESCERSRIFGPALADAYARYRILTPDQLEAYRASLPTSCP